MPRDYEWHSVINVALTEAGLDFGHNGKSIPGSDYVQFEIGSEELDRLTWGPFPKHIGDKYDVVVAGYELGTSYGNLEGIHDLTVKYAPDCKQLLKATEFAMEKGIAIEFDL